MNLEGEQMTKKRKRASTGTFDFNCVKCRGHHTTMRGILLSFLCLAVLWLPRVADSTAVENPALTAESDVKMQPKAYARVHQPITNMVTSAGTEEINKDTGSDFVMAAMVKELDSSSNNTKMDELSTVFSTHGQSLQESSTEADPISASHKKRQFSRKQPRRAMTKKKGFKKRILAAKYIEQSFAVKNQDGTHTSEQKLGRHLSSKSKSKSRHSGQHSSSKSKSKSEHSGQRAYVGRHRRHSNYSWSSSNKWQYFDPPDETGWRRKHNFKKKVKRLQYYEKKFFKRPVQSLDGCDD
jgi:hypothetical protein